MEERESSESRINVILKEESPEVLKEGKKKKKAFCLGPRKKSMKDVKVS